MLESVPGTNQYWAMTVTVIMLKKTIGAFWWGFELTLDRHQPFKSHAFESWASCNLDLSHIEKHEARSYTTLNSTYIFMAITVFYLTFFMAITVFTSFLMAVTVLPLSFHGNNSLYLTFFMAITVFTSHFSWRWPFSPHIYHGNNRFYHSFHGNNRFYRTHFIAITVLTIYYVLQKNLVSLKKVSQILSRLIQADLSYNMLLHKCMCEAFSVKCFIQQLRNICQANIYTYKCHHKCLNVA